MWWTGGGLLVVLLLLLGWRVSLEIPERLAGVERSIHATVARYGLRVAYANLKFHPLHFRVSLDNLVVIDDLAGMALADAGSVDVSISPLRFLAGDVPVSRIRVRNFHIKAGESNRALYERLSSGKGGTSSEDLPEVLLVDGSVLLGPLGPVRRLEAVVRELRVRSVRFLGTRVTAAVESASGEIDIPGAGTGAWPYSSLEADLLHKDGVLRVRRLRATGDASSVRISGFIDTKKELLDGKLSGEVDLARWIAAGAPGSGVARSVVREGKAEFSAAVSGPWNDPQGTGKILLRKAAFPGVPPTDGGAEVSLAARVVRLSRLQAKVWGGSLEASGSYDIAAGKMEGKASLRRVSLSTIPWDAFGVPARISGTGDLTARVEGSPDRLRGTVSLSLPDGAERIPAAGESRFSLRVPLSADISAEMQGGRQVRIASFRLQAGRAETRGEGAVSLADGALRLRGSVVVPAGKAADYGWLYPLSWEGAEGTWEIAGPPGLFQTMADLRVKALAVHSLPPLPLRVKVDGAPAETLHFVADLPGLALKVTAVGTVASLLKPSRARADITVALRDIDLSEGGRWVTAVAASLGKDAGELPHYLAGAEGMAEGDARLAFSSGNLELSGSARSRRLSVRGVPLHDMTAEGEYGLKGESPRWSARVSGELGDGTVRLEARGAAAGSAEASGSIERLEIAQALSLLKQGNPSGLRGILESRLAMKEGPRGWEVPRIVAETKELSVGNVKFADVHAEGSLGIAEGKFSVSSSSPRVTLTGEVRRGDGWPAKFSLAVADVPTSFLLAAAGRAGKPSEGFWSAEADGVLQVGDLLEGERLSVDTVPALQATIRSKGPSVGDLRFEECRATGRRQGDTIAGDIETRLPDTRLSWSVDLREPFGFRVEGPFSFGEAGTAVPKDEKRHYSLRGRAELEGSLRALEKTTGTVQVETLIYREGGLEFSAKDLSTRMDPEGFRWTGGTILAAGNLVKVSGGVTWKGELDARLDGKVPAAAVRLVVPGVFERLDGILTVGVRITGRLDDPTIVGTARVEGATLSFLGYAQLFDSIRADAVISREKIIFEHFEGRSGGGYIDGWGEVPLKTDAGQRLFFSVDFLDVRYPYPEDFRPVIQGHAELIGPVDDLLVTGDVEVQSARYTRNLYPERALVDISRKLSDTAARREKSEFRMRLDINVVADRTIRIKNNLADMKASGEFKVEGDTRKVIVLGAFDVYEGYVELYGSRYDLKRVTVDFQDPRRINPRLDARAETKKGSYNIAVLVTGTFEKPEVDFTSDPPLSRTDIVSLLAFGVTTQNLASPGTGAGSSSGGGGAAAIAIGTSVGGVDEKIRSTVGLDKFAIETGFSQTTQSLEPRFVVGKSFGDRVSISASTSVGTSAYSSASGELQLWEDVYLQGSWQSSTAYEQGQFGGDLKVRYRYRSFKDLLGGKD